MYNLNDYASSNPLDHLHGSETHHRPYSGIYITLLTMYINILPTYHDNNNNTGEGNGQFNAPTGVAVDTQDNILVADWGNSRIQVRSAIVNLCFIDLCFIGF